MQIAWTPYTTPTPLPNRPDWNASDWKNYFKGNHPNFWFKEKLMNEKIAKLEKEKLIVFMGQQDEKSEEDQSINDDKPLKSNFFKNPLRPQPEEWINWPPEKWVEWSESEEYRDLYTSPTNIYRPSGVKQPESPPVLGYREKMPVILTQWSTPTPASSTPPVTKEYVRERNKEVTRGKVSPPPETFFPDPTQSPTEDPNYIYLQENYDKSKSSSRSQLSDIKPQFVINEERRDPASISSDYLYNKNFESSGLPSSEYNQLSNLEFERYKDRNSGAINPSLLLLMENPNYAKDGLPAAELEFDVFNQDNFPVKTSFQEGLSPERFETGFVQDQGSVPAQGDPQDPQSRPPAANIREQQNRFRPPQFRPGRPGQPGFQRGNNQPPRRVNPNLPDTSNLSPEVHLPPINPNNPNFQNVYQNSDPQINPYFPPNNPGYFSNQYPPPQGASSSTSTSTGGGGSSAAASSSAGFSSSSSTSVSEGGNNNNDNKYFECTGPQCSDNRDEDKPFSITDENRNVFFSDEMASSTTTKSPVRETNFLENIKFPNGGDQQINLNIPQGVSPPPDLQEAINNGGDINLNCDRTNGCPTLIPLQERVSTTPTTTQAPGFRISISPLFGNIRNGNREEETSSGTETTSDERRNEVRDQLLANAASINREATDELPIRGLGDDYVNEIYELDAPTSFSRPSSGIIAQGNRVATIGDNINYIQPNRLSVSSSERVAEIPSVKENANGDTTTAEDLKSIVKALSGLLQLLNNTGRRKTNAPKVNLTQPFGLGHLGGKRYPVKNIIFDDEATFSKIKSQNLPDGDIIYYNLKKKLPRPQHQNVPSYFNSNTDTTTIPPHLIPLGPDGSPLVEPDGSFIIPGNYGQRNELSQMFPYLNDRNSFTTRAPATSSTTEAILNTTSSTEAERNNSSSDNRDMITRTIDMIHDMPMNTKRHMLANMVVGVPMAAITMVAAGLPPLGNISEPILHFQFFKIIADFLTLVECNPIESCSLLNSILSSRYSDLSCQLLLHWPQLFRDLSSLPSLKSILIKIRTETDLPMEPSEGMDCQVSYQLSETSMPTEEKTRLCIS